MREISESVLTASIIYLTSSSVARESQEIIRKTSAEISTQAMNAMYRTFSAKSQLYEMNGSIVFDIINTVVGMPELVVKQELADTTRTEYIVERNILDGILPQLATSIELRQLMMNVGVQRPMFDITSSSVSGHTRSSIDEPISVSLNISGITPLSVIMQRAAPEGK